MELTIDTNTTANEVYVKIRNTNMWGHGKTLSEAIKDMNENFTFQIEEEELEYQKRLLI
jgi:hypothetical protein